MREALESLYFAASHCSDLPELKDVREIMANKYGKEFSAGSLVSKQVEIIYKLFFSYIPTCESGCVNIGNNFFSMFPSQFLQAFYETIPSEDCKKALMKEICAEFHIKYPPQVSIYLSCF